MDPVSHAAFARTLIGALDRARGHPTLDVPIEWPRRRFVAAAVLGALSPDLDLVIMPFGWDRYLRVHEVGTHTVLGTLACALLTAAVIHRFAGPTRYSSLAFSAWIGAASHVALDLLSGARLRPLWPLADAVASVPLVAMADPWLLALCIIGAAASSIGGGSRRRRAGAAALAATSVFLLAKAALGLIAVANYRKASERSGEVVLARVVEAEWASLNRWHVFDRTAHELRTWSAGNGGVQVLFSWPVEPESPTVARSRSFSTVRNFLRAHELGFAATLSRGEGGTLVLWSDIRFCWDAALPEARRLEPVIQSATGNQRIACAVWFGGELDAAGRPRLEVVKVGGITQTRAPGP